MNIELHIEEIVLDGFPAADRRRIAEALAEELDRLLRTEGLPAWANGAGETPFLDGGALLLDPGARAEDVVDRLARAIYGGQAP